MTQPPLNATTAFAIASDSDKKGSTTHIFCVVADEHEARQYVKSNNDRLSKLETDYETVTLELEGDEHSAFLASLDEDFPLETATATPSYPVSIQSRDGREAAEAAYAKIKQDHALLLKQIEYSNINMRLCVSGLPPST